MIKVDAKSLMRQLDGNLIGRRLRALRLSQKCNDQLDSLYYEQFKIGDRKSFSQIVEEAVDLYYRLFMKAAEEEEKEKRGTK
jgi:hypothetical protein